MEDIENFKGYLIAAHPKRSESYLKQSVLLIIDHDFTGTIGLQINKPMVNSTSLKTVMDSLGISYKGDEPVYFGGTENLNRIIVVHSSDWSSTTTTVLSNEVSMSNDISVLAAIAAGKGPSKFRAIAGYTDWMAGQLEAEIEGEFPFNDISKSWSIINSKSNLVFNNEGIEQWHLVLEQSAKSQIASWF